MNQLATHTFPDANTTIADKAALVLILVKMLLVVPGRRHFKSGFIYDSSVKSARFHALGVMASFIGCTGNMRVIAGYLGDRIVNHCQLLLLCTFFLTLGCLIMTVRAYFYYGLTSIAVGAGLSIAVNCLLTDIFRMMISPEKLPFSAITAAWIWDTLLVLHWADILNYIIKIIRCLWLLVFLVSLPWG